MMRINLLPPETLDRRRAEKRIGYVVLAAVGIAIMLAVVWGWAYMRLDQKKKDLALVEQEVQAAQAQANQLVVFEERASDLEKRRAIVTEAFAGRRDWAKLFDEISLVLPEDLWVQSLTAAEIEGLGVTGYAVDSPTDSPNVGHKSIAKGLVRLADLEQLSDVWLTTSQEVVFAEQDAIQFTITAKVDAPSSGGGAQ